MKTNTVIYIYIYLSSWSPPIISLTPRRGVASTHEPNPVTCKLRKHYYLVGIYAIPQTKERKSVRKHTNLHSSYFSTFHCCFHQSIYHRSIDAYDETHYINIPSILGMKRLSIVRLQDAISQDTFIRALTHAFLSQPVAWVWPRKEHPRNRVMSHQRK